MLNLAHKPFLFLLLALPLLIGWKRFLRHRGRRHIRVSAQTLFGLEPPGLKARLLQLLFPVKLTALALLILALARPQLLRTQRSEQARGFDILLALDISGSMGSIDFKPKNRLEVAKEMIAGFINRRSSDRIGLVAFAATAYTKCPLTIDYEILRHFLAETQLGEIEDGTAIGMALATAVNRLRTSTAKTKIIILLTDGNNNRGEIDPRDAARMARDASVKVYTIGAGTRGEAPYPIVDQLGQQQYVMVQVDIDETLLQDIARSTGGLYFRATDRDSLQRIFADIDRWEKSDIAVKTTTEVTEFFPYFIAAGLILLLAVEILRRSYLRVLP